jgi:hypothetical protein
VDASVDAAGVAAAREEPAVKSASEAASAESPCPATGEAGVGVEAVSGDDSAGGEWRVSRVIGPVHAGAMMKTGWLSGTTAGMADVAVVSL